jgi:NAD(P)-dependent dehydrogenase (short-subunit alcohol dehydrogenase family)
MTFSSDPTEFVGKRVLVTGGTKGMGEAIVRRLADGGATVATTARSPRPESQSGGLFVQADISTRAGVDHVSSEVIARLGGVDILINNVGGSSAPSGGVLALSDDDWHDTINANLLAAVRLDRAFLPGMLERGSGVIIHISSIQRRLPLFEATLAYAAAKAALTTYSKGLSKEVGPKGVRVNTVAPGYIETQMLSKLTPHYKAKMTKQTPMGRFGCPEDVSGMVEFLASDAAGYVTGQIISVDGGLGI